MLPKYCDGINRREFLKVGSLGSLSLAEVLRLQHVCSAESNKNDINCIFVFGLGGMPHQDMWDVKPDAPAEIRGDFNPIKTAVPGMHVSDVLPKIFEPARKI